MTETDTQAVAPETEGQAAPAPEATSAQEPTQNLDQLLSEFTTETAKSKPAPQAPAAPAASESEALRKVAELEFKIEFPPILQRIRGDIPEDVLGNEELTDLLDGRAKRDPALREAFANRASNPRGWARIEKALNAEYSQRFQSRVDANATADREAVSAAVRGTSTKVPEQRAPNYGAMTDAEFAKEKAKYGL